jgi:hypothetical protein
MKEDFTGLYNIRDVRYSDMNFIFTTFLKGLYHGDSWFSIIPQDIFMRNYNRFLHVLISRSNIRVACLPDDADVILGYSIMSKEGQELHWVFTKTAWRHKGIARALVPTTVTVVTHLTKVGRILKNKYPGIVFDPFRV